MARIFLGVVIAAGIYLLLRAVLDKKPLSLKQFFSIYVAILLIIGLIGLGLTGRLHPITASLGVGLTVLTRALPMLMRMFQAVNLWRTLKAALGMASAQQGPKSGNHSEVDGHYLRMRLDHDSGELDGTILAGRFTGEVLRYSRPDSPLKRPRQNRCPAHQRRQLDWLIKTDAHRKAAYNGKVAHLL